MPGMASVQQIAHHAGAIQLQIRQLPLRFAIQQRCLGLGRIRLLGFGP